MKKPQRLWIRLLGLSLVLFLLAIPSGLLWNLTRPALHKDIINKYAAVYKMDPLYVMALVKVESSFQKDARSHRGAIGLMQLMPNTAREMAQRLGKKNISLTEIEEPETNIQLGFHYLSVLREEFPEDSLAQLAAYNAGPANVRFWIQEGAPLTLEKIAFPETAQFVKKVTTTHKWLKRLQKIKKVIRA